MDWFKPKVQSPEEKIDKERFDVLKEIFKDPDAKKLEYQFIGRTSYKLPTPQYREFLALQKKYKWTGGKTRKGKKRIRRKSLKK